MGGMDIPEVEAAAVPEDAFLLDVREPDEWRAGHAPDAIHIPLGEVPQRLGELPADRPVYVICRSGHRSAQVTVWLNHIGWQAANVAGGMYAWSAAGRPMTSDTTDAPYVA